MAWGKLDDKEFQAFADKVKERISAQELKKEIGLSSKSVGVKAISLVKRRTPVDKGILKRNWYMEGPYISGMVIAIKIYNNKEYASFVEDGHRTRTPHTPESIKRSKGVHWVPGTHMLMKTLFELDAQMPQLLSPGLKKALGDLFD